MIVCFSLFEIICKKKSSQNFIHRKLNKMIHEPCTPDGTREYSPNGKTPNPPDRTYAGTQSTSKTRILWMMCLMYPVLSKQLVEYKPVESSRKVE